MIDPVLHDITTRLSETEKNNAIMKAVADERRKQMDDRFDKLEKSVVDTRTELANSIAQVQRNFEASTAKTTSMIEKLLMLVAGSIIAYVVKWLLSGQLLQ